VGVIAYVLSVGYSPFQGKDNDDIHQAVLDGWYSFPSGDWSGTSREALNFIQRFLQMDTRKRMTTEQALSHPWITSAVTTKVEQKDGQSKEANIEGSKILYCKSGHN
jgi:serine/threonine protein kinase